MSEVNNKLLRAGAPLGIVRDFHVELQPGRLFASDGLIVAQATGPDVRGGKRRIQRSIGSPLVSESLWLEMQLGDVRTYTRFIQGQVVVIMQREPLV